MKSNGAGQELPQQGAIRLYVHIPFCVKKCSYCDFLSGPSCAEDRRRYLDALACEIANTRQEGAYVRSIFIGGGTPSVLETGQMERLFSLLHQHFRILPDAEITVECNPGTTDQEKLSAYRKMGINRLSLGVQSFHDPELLLLGRIHTAKQARECFDMARAAGFRNINLDLMSALPGQSFADWMDNLKEAAALGPEHISAYSLIIEDGTPFAASYRAGSLPPLPDEETDRRMYHETKHFLEDCGYHRYEISNYARDGFECAHNIGYWTGDTYLGLGAGASSYAGGIRFSNQRDLSAYCEAAQRLRVHPRGRNGFDEALEQLRADKTVLTGDDKFEEFMFLGLRMTRGISIAEFQKRFGVPIDEVYHKEIEDNIAKGLLVLEGGRLFLTEFGTDVCNTVMADFIRTAV